MICYKILTTRIAEQLDAGRGYPYTAQEGLPLRHLPVVVDRDEDAIVLAEEQIVVRVPARVQRRFADLRRVLLGRAFHENFGERIGQSCLGEKQRQREEKRFSKV